MVAVTSISESWPNLISEDIIMKIRKTIALVTGGSVLLALAYAVAMANCIGCPPPGSIMTCGPLNFSCTATASGPGINGTFTTTAVVLPRFQVVGGTTGGGDVPASSSLQPQQWQGTGNSPTLGAVNWQFDVSRSVANTTIIANQLGEDFPATAHIRFHIRGTLGAVPGVTFESVTPLDVTNSNVHSFAPFVNESFTLAAPVLFRQVGNPQGRTFTLTTLTLKLNG
jgi:hypothetical protein